MRDIKFRAWENYNIEMVYFDNEKSANDPYIAQHLLLLLADKHPNGPALVMQFTGLLDKNGVEIYEGDIVSDHVGVGSVEYIEHHGSFRVNYNDGKAKWFVDYTLRGERGSIEVIGNIHENPKLLEAS